MRDSERIVALGNVKKLRECAVIDSAVYVIEK